MARTDVIVIGSGFGGAVMACRLAERGLAVLVLERGRRWRVGDYPRSPGDAWIYDEKEPERQNGWLDLRFFDDMIVAQGAGVGGGSLIYANVSVEAPPFLFDSGWPAEITLDELRPYYDRVVRTMNVQELPDNQLSRRFRLMKEGAEALGHGDRFHKVGLAVSFDPEWTYDHPDPHSPARSKRHVNAQGQEQGTCIHCGDCDLGCPVSARNTLDLNYLPWAEKHGAEIRPLHLVRSIEPLGDRGGDGGWRVHFDRLEDGRKIPGHEDAAQVVIAAGSLGSTELLLRCRYEHKTLPNVSGFLGRNWSSNGDFLTPAFYEREIRPTEGPTISSAIDFLDGSQGGQRFYIEDGGFPDLLENYLEAKLESGTGMRRLRPVLASLRATLMRQPSLRHVMPWFAQGIDAADGRLYLGRRWLAPWKRVLKLDWEIERSEAVIDAICEMHVQLAEATGGRPWTPPTWTLLRNLVTPHPLGGCNLGNGPHDGVVDHRGRVFGYRNLAVVDGAIVPEAIGRNPTRTIAALAERCAELWEA